MADPPSPRADTEALAANAALMDKYSRQIGAFGMEAMSKLMSLKVLIIGLKGVGVETAKNLILAGPGSVTLWDDAPVEIRDLGSNFFLTETDVGKPRAQVVAPKLAELNSMVTVRVAHSKGQEEGQLLAAHNVVVATTGTLADLTRWDDFCRSHGITFIGTEVKGVVGYVFSDFGPRFTVRDITGENPVTRIITHIANDEAGTVTLLPQEDGGRVHGIEESEHDGWVEISDVSGMECGEDIAKSVNDMGPFKIKHVNKTVEEVKDGVKKTKQVFDGYRLAIGDTRGYSPYQNGGVLTQVKRPVSFSHRSLKDNLVQPVPPGEWGLLFTDGAKYGRAEQIHIALQGLWKFEEVHGRLPHPNSDQDAEEVVRLATERNKELAGLEEGKATSVSELEADVPRKLALYAAVEFQPYCATFGGIVAQEVVKCTGKYQPLNQWLHLDCLEVLPSERPTDTAPRNSRYDDLITIFGAAFVDKMANAKTFMVGCGALGCEYLKNFALLGIGAGEEGAIIVTDNDRIEVSNLNRQFLFREKNVGQPKSLAASQAALTMNRHLKIQAKELLVAPQTENVFNDPFWEHLDFVTNALDNVKARLYVDSRCVFYSKPLLESGTLGPKCNVQVVIPHLTASYADGPKDQEDEDNIPMCTLRNFPSLIEHCIEWARAQFNDLFVDSAAAAKKFLADKEAYLADAKACLTNGNSRGNSPHKHLEGLRAVKAFLDTARGATFEKMMDMAFSLFHKLFRDKLLQLVHNFPKDFVTASGEKFWTGAKRFPQVIHFDPHNEAHIGFVIAAANIFAVNYGISEPPEKTLVAHDHAFRNEDYVKKHLGTLPIPVWTPTNEKIDLGNGEEKKEKKEDEVADDDAMEVDSVADEGQERAELASLVQELQTVDTNGLNAEPAEFEKDQDLNFHIDFITTASNLRASNYRIKQASRHKCKMIAGKIIPAIATATASVTGLASVELIKALQGKPLEAYKDSSNNLGLNMYFLQEPVPPEKAKERYDDVEMANIIPYPAGFTKWDKIVIDRGELTLGQFLEAFKAQTGLNVTLLYHKAADLDGPHKGRFLYNADEYLPANKQLYASKVSCPLKDWVMERYEGAPVEIVGQYRKYLELQTSCSDDNGAIYITPTVIYRWAH